MRKLFIFIAILEFSFIPIHADELKEGYLSFKENKISVAIQHFTAASQQQETKAEANLMLSLLSSVDQPQAASFKYFYEFYKNCTDYNPYVLGLFHHSGVIGYEALKSEQQLAWMNEITQKNDVNPTLKAYIYEDLAKYYEYVHDIKKSREYFSKIGAITDWQITGDFDNISGSGFEKFHEPITHPEPEAIFKNKINAPIKWFDLYKQINGKWIDLTYNFYCKNSLFYAQTFCNSSTDQQVYVRIGTSGSLKLWVNDQLMFKEEEERNNGIDTYIIPVKLFKGNNRIMLQLGCSKIDQCNFLMRVTDKQGQPLNQLAFSKKYAPYNKTTQEASDPIISESEAYFTKQINAQPDKLLNYLVLANVYLSNDKNHEALEVLQKVQVMAPNCSFILDQLLELYSREKNKTLISLTREKLKQVDPEKSSVLNFLINSAFEANNLKEARQIIDKKEQLYGKNKDVYYYKLKLAADENKSAEYASLIKESYEKFPDDYQFVGDKYDFEKEVKQNQKAALKVLKEFTKKYFNKTALENLADDYLQQGQTKDGVAILTDLINTLPFNDSYYKQLGNYYLQSGNYALAKPLLEECLKIAPYYGMYHGNYAKVFEETGDKVSAIREYQSDITYMPDDYETIKKLRTLQGKNDPFENFTKKDYYKLYENSPSATDYPSDNILSLSEDRQVVLYEQGGCETRQVFLFKALTLKGIDILKEYNIGYNRNENLTIEKAEILKKNGNRLEAEINNNQIVYTSLEPGDAVFLIYKLTKSVSDEFSKHFSLRMLMNNWYPSLNIQYDLLVSKNIPIQYRSDNSSINPEIMDKDEFKLYSWVKTNNKAMQLETYMPAMVDAGELVSVTTFKDWDYLSKWYYDISNTKTKPDQQIIDKVQELLKGKENKSEFEKARIFYNFIEQTIRYSSVSFRQSGIIPQKASDVLTTRIGDCKDLSVLFTSMCRVAKIDAGVVLVLRRQNGLNWKNLPSFDFDHAIAKAILDGKEYYIELTSSYYPFAALGDNHLNAIVLDVDKDSTHQVIPKLLNPSTRQPNNLYREAKISFSGDNMKSEIVTTRTGILAAVTRSNYRDIGKEEREKNFTQSIATNYPNVKLQSLNFNASLFDCSDTLSYSYKCISPNVFTKLNDMLIVKLPLTDRVLPMSHLSIEERKFPIETLKYGGCDTLVEKLIITIPEKKTLIEIPKSVQFKCNQEEYSLTFKVQGNELQVLRKMIYKSDQIPVSEYNTYRNFVESVVSSDAIQIGFK